MRVNTENAGITLKADCMPKNGRAVSENLTDFQPFIYPFPISIISISHIRELKFYLLKDSSPLKALFIN